MKLSRARLSYANVMSTIAVLLALGGSAYAVTITSSNVKDESLLSRDIHNGTIKSVDLGSNSVTGTKIAANTITNSDVNLNDLTTWRNDINTIRPGIVTVNSGATYDGILDCTSTAHAVTGGVYTDQTHLVTLVSHPGINLSTWILSVKNDGPESADIELYVQCINTAPPL